jgi:hypothetical protein
MLQDEESMGTEYEESKNFRLGGPQGLQSNTPLNGTEGNNHLLSSEFIKLSPEPNLTTKTTTRMFFENDHNLDFLKSGQEEYDDVEFEYMGEEDEGMYDEREPRQYLKPVSL